MFAGRAARHHRGEHPEPRARHDPDGDLQQVRRHGADDRQQERDVGRLRHALRRHERRLQSDQGPLQDGGLPPRALAQRACAQGRQGAGRRGHPREHHHAGRRPRSCARTRPTRTRCRPTRCSTTSWPAWSSRRCRSPTSSARGHAPETVRRVERLLYLAEYKRRQAAPGVKISARNFGRDRRYPITNKFREEIAGRRSRPAVTGRAADGFVMRCDRPQAGAWAPSPSSVARNLKRLREPGMIMSTL